MQVLWSVFLLTACSAATETTPGAKEGQSLTPPVQSADEIEERKLLDKKLEQQRVEDKIQEQQRLDKELEQKRVEDKLEEQRYQDRLRNK